LGCAQRGDEAGQGVVPGAGVVGHGVHWGERCAARGEAHGRGA
jgi:hypothetical protein